MKLSRWLRGVFALILAIALVATAQAPVNAASDYDYDELIVTTDTATVGYTWSGGCTIDVTESWSSLMYAGLTGSAKTSFANRVAWVVSQVASTEDGTNWSTALHVQWWEASELPAILEFQPPLSTYSPTKAYLNALDGHGAHISPVAPSCTTTVGRFPDFQQSYVAHNGEGVTRTIFASSGVSITYPAGYEGELLPSESAYVALGDSYSSGEGAYSYIDDGTECHRSTLSYPYTLSSSMSKGLDLVACSGAITDDLYTTSHKNSSEVGQLLRVGDATEVITMTIGGNDAGFKDVMDYCVHRTGTLGYFCANDTSMTLPLSERMVALADLRDVETEGPLNVPGTTRPIHSIKSVLRDVAEAAPNATIYIAGYPKLFGENPSYYDYEALTPGDHTCVVNSSFLSQVEARIGLSDAVWLNDQTDLLNGIINDAAEDIALEGKNVHYVPPSTFDTHGVCDSGTQWLNDVDLGTGFSPLNESFHPNLLGMNTGYVAAFDNEMD